MIYGRGQPNLQRQYARRQIGGYPRVAAPVAPVALSAYNGFAPTQVKWNGAPSGFMQFRNDVLNSIGAACISHILEPNYVIPVDPGRPRPLQSFLDAIDIDAQGNPVLDAAGNPVPVYANDDDAVADFEVYSKQWVSDNAYYTPREKLHKENVSEFFGIIRSHIDVAMEANLAPLIRTSDFLGLWNALNVAGVPQAKTELDRIFFNFADAPFNPTAGQTMLSLINQHDTAAEEMAHNDERVSEEMKKFNLLKKVELATAGSTFYSAILVQARGADPTTNLPYTYKRVCEFLRGEESRLQADETRFQIRQTQALAYANPHSYAAAIQQSDISSATFSGKCFFCNDYVGHMIKDCPFSYQCSNCQRRHAHGAHCDQYQYQGRGGRGGGRGGNGGRGGGGGRGRGDHGRNDNYGRGGGGRGRGGGGRGGRSGGRGGYDGRNSGGRNSGSYGPTANQFNQLSRNVESMAGSLNGFINLFEDVNQHLHGPQAANQEP